MPNIIVPAAGTGLPEFTRRGAFAFAAVPAAMVAGASLLDESLALVGGAAASKRLAGLLAQWAACEAAFVPDEIDREAHAAWMKTSIAIEREIVACGPASSAEALLLAEFLAERAGHLVDDWLLVDGLKSLAAFLRGVA